MSGAIISKAILAFFVGSGVCLRKAKNAKTAIISKPKTLARMYHLLLLKNSLNFPSGFPASGGKRFSPGAIASISSKETVFADGT